MICRPHLQGASSSTPCLAPQKSGFNSLTANSVCCADLPPPSSVPTCSSFWAYCGKDMEPKPGHTKCASDKCTADDCCGKIPPPHPSCRGRDSTDKRVPARFARFSQVCCAGPHHRKKDHGTEVTLMTRTDLSRTLEPRPASSGMSSGVSAGRGPTLTSLSPPSPPPPSAASTCPNPCQLRSAPTIFATARITYRASGTRCLAWARSARSPNVVVRCLAQNQHYGHQSR